jgi:hypothetical protein
MQFRLRTPHVIEGAVRAPGTIVGPYGSGAPIVFQGDPTPDMEGVDDEGRAKVKEVFQRLRGYDPPWDLPPAQPGQPVLPGQPVAQEKPYADEGHSDNAEQSDEEREKLAQELDEANKKHWVAHGTAPVQTLPIPGASVTAIGPMGAETPQDQAVPADRPLGQQLPDVQPGAAAQSPSAEAAKEAAKRSVPRRGAPSVDDEDC